VLICDTGVLVAAAIASDPDNRACVDLFAGMRLAKRRLVVPAPVIAEVGFLLEKYGGVAAEAAFLRSLAAGDFSLEPTTAEDLARAGDLVEQYANLPLGTTDAIVVATAERLGCTEVGTLDHRDFSVVRPRHIAAFTLLP
jgi:predicted nucleic acid-binding protein